MSYEDILYLSHHQSTKRKHMSLHDRAAQFAPFAALSGHDRAIRNTELEAEYIVENANRGETYYDD